MTSDIASLYSGWDQQYDVDEHGEPGPRPPDRNWPAPPTRIVIVAVAIAALVAAIAS